MLGAWLWPPLLGWGSFWMPQRYSLVRWYSWVVLRSPCTEVLTAPLLGHSSVMVAGLIRHPGQMASVTCRWSGKDMVEDWDFHVHANPTVQSRAGQICSKEGPEGSPGQCSTWKGATVFLASSSSETVGWEKCHVV